MTVGFSIVESDDLSLVQLGHWSLKKFQGLYAKADHIVGSVAEVTRSYAVESPVWIEEPVMRFTPGMSSAQTISMLISFNAMVSYGIHSRLGHRIEHVKPGDARRSCGLVMTTKAKSGGFSQKEQVYRQLTASNGLLSNVCFPLTKTNKPKQENYDRTDAYVVARHGALQVRR